MLEPPREYRPETADRFVAGTIGKDRSVVVQQIELLPSSIDDPTYVWALVGVPE